MGQIDENVIKKLDRILLKGSPILFTGAGFSKFAINGDGETVPDGYQLKKALIEKLLLIDESEPEFSELMDSSLSDLCSYCEYEKGEDTLRDYLNSVLSGCKPQPFHKIIANFAWKKVYTTN